MLFSSITFLLFFFPTVLILYYILPSIVYRNTVLLVFSLFFYAWGEPKYVLLMLASIVFNYNAGLFIVKNSSFKKKKVVLAIAVLVNLSVLFVFKYLGFSEYIVNTMLRTLHLKQLSVIKLIMPIGISFYTFQEISYLVDVYRKPESVQKDVLKLGLYIAFFPQLIAGPIVRYHDIIEQIEQRSHSAEKFATGMERFIIGLSKKTLLANAFALVCDKIYDANIFHYGAYEAWIACLAYSLQIYYDFSGYSDMAIGLAKMFGFDLQENFNYPYAASSITDFWKRWHISLTNFFRDYLYIPLGGNRKGKNRTVLNRFIVFFTTGLWHGAAFNFILWGIGHGVLMTIERFKIKNVKTGGGTRLSQLVSLLPRLYTLICVSFLWVLFRNGTKKTVKLFLKMFGINYTIFTNQVHEINIDPFLRMYIDNKFFILVFIGIMFSFPWWHRMPRLESKYVKIMVLCGKYLVLLFLFVLSYSSLASNSYNPFIYFRF